MGVISTAKPREPMVMGKEIRKYTVWLNGKRMTDKRVTYSKAKALCNRYENMGYKDFVIKGVIDDKLD